MTSLTSSLHTFCAFEFMRPTSLATVRVRVRARLRLRLRVGARVRVRVRLKVRVRVARLAMVRVWSGSEFGSG